MHYIAVSSFTHGPYKIDQLGMHQVRNLDYNYGIATKQYKQDHTPYSEKKKKRRESYLNLAAR